MKISVSESAMSDLEEIRRYYAEEGVPHVGEQFVKAVIEHIETLSEHPDIGRMVPEFNTKTIRELIHSPFRIVYLRDIKSIHVIRIWRSERLLKLPDGCEDAR